MDIPVFHDDQHGTAIISGAALVNAARIADKGTRRPGGRLLGRGRQCDRLCPVLRKPRHRRGQHRHVRLGRNHHHRPHRTRDLNQFKAEFARDIPGGDLADAMAGTDVFVGLSIGGIVDQEMVQSMADNPIVFAMANPDPRISYGDAKAARDDTVIMATGRSDYRTRSTTSSGSRSSSGARSTCGPRR